MPAYCGKAHNCRIGSVDCLVANHFCYENLRRLMLISRPVSRAGVIRIMATPDSTSPPLPAAIPHLHCAPNETAVARAGEHRSSLSILNLSCLKSDQGPVTAFFSLATQRSQPNAQDQGPENPANQRTERFCSPIGNIRVAARNIELRKFETRCVN